MKYKITTNYAPCALEVKVHTLQPEKLFVRVYDAKNPQRRFTDRFMTVTGNQTFTIRMPLSPEVCVVEVYGTGGPNKKREEETNFGIDSVKIVPLKRKIDPSDIANSQIRSFVDFAQRFCYTLDELQTGKYYQSSDDNTYILLSDKIRNKEGVEINTPARVGRKTGIIEVSKEAFMKMTYPSRVAILTHEYSHFFLNEKIDDEMEADLNGLLIYLGLGYPRIEAIEVFTKTFEGAPSQLNEDRTKLILKFINDFESMNMVLS